MSDNRDESSPYFNVSPGEWSEIDGALRADLVRVEGAINVVVQGGEHNRPSPIEMALLFQEVASKLFDHLAGEERDMRQVISTLRTAHAVAWDTVDAVSATRMTVEQFMLLLRTQIDGFESDLKALQERRTNEADA